MTPYNWQKTNLTEAVKSLNPTWYLQGKSEFDTTSTRIITDTRKLKQGDIFLAIKGDNFDGHDYLATAKDKGAVLAIVSRPVVMQSESELPQLIVSDTKIALGRLGEYRRDQHPNLKVVAITGSMGKTTAKEMLGSILSQLAPTLITRGNLNNDLGVPMMLLELCDEHEFAVMELGANHVGEIAYTTTLVKPDVACILNIGTAHLGEFGGRDNIAKTKAEIYQGLSASLNKQGIAVVPFGDDYFDDLTTTAEQFSQSILTFGEQVTTYEKAGIDPNDFADFEPTDDDTVLLMGDVFADDVEVYGDHSTFSLNVNLDIDDIESVNIRLNFGGEHNVSNALASTACAVALGVPLDVIATGLENAKPAKGRLNFIHFDNHLFIDDTYNSNPSAVLAGANVLANQDGYKVLVLGDIGELGDEAVQEHGKLGENLAKLAQQNALDKLLVVGDLMTHTATLANSSTNLQKPDFAIHFANKADLTVYLNQLLQEKSSNNQACSVLFKGSRFMAMETVLNELMQK